jgi:hypothetical protein
MRQTLEILRDQGVTEALINQHWQPSYPTGDWDGFNRDALCYFVTGRNPELFIEHLLGNTPPLAPELRLSPIDALHEISRLDNNGLHALVWLYPHGLRGEHLRNWHGVTPTDRIFSASYQFALCELVRERGVSVEEALQQITGITWDEADSIFAGVSRQQNSL